MAHYAFIQNVSTVSNIVSYIVTEVIVGKDETESPGNWEQVYSEVRGGQLCLRTSFNTTGNVHYGPDGNPDDGTPFRGNYAGIGYIYDHTNDVFYPPQPYPSWYIGDHTNWLWVPPTPMPNDGKLYRWDEESLNWIEIN